MDLPQPCLHTYESLATDKQEIRIAIIEPAMEREAPIRFTFHTASLEDLEGRYEALSYIWGEPKLVYPVYHTSDGTRLLVTESLNYALRRLRYKADRRWLWADALCINQRDDAEKASQIPLMIDIFRGANGVVAWLHPDNESIERGMRCVERMSRQALGQRAGARENDEDKNRSNRSSAFELFSHADTVTKDSSETNRFLTGAEAADVRAFFALPYFKRLWIIQELVSSLDVRLVCGQMELSWLRMITILTVATTTQPLDLDGAIPLLQTANLWRSRCIDRDPAVTHILDLVLEYSSYGCTDARDRVFAVHALSQARNADMKIDYSLDVCTVYHNFAVACNLDGRAVDILKAASARADAVSTELPSWVPDWRISVIDDSFRYDHVSQGDSMIYTSELVRGQFLRVSFSPFRIYTKYALTWSLRVSKETPLGPNQPLHAFIDAIFRLYAKTCWPSARGLGFLIAVLVVFWSKGSSKLTSPHFEALWECLQSRRSADRLNYTRCIAENEKLLADPIVAASKGRCFFEAKFTNNINATYFCYGSVSARGDDVLMPLEAGFSSMNNVPCTNWICRMCVLRPLDHDGGQEAPEGSRVAWTGSLYRLVGEAWLVYFPYDQVVAAHGRSNATVELTLC